jgi:hypothetical protein
VSRVLSACSFGFESACSDYLGLLLVSRWTGVCDRLSRQDGELLVESRKERGVAKKPIYNVVSFFSFLFRKQVKVWQRTDESDISSWAAVATINTKEPATAVTMTVASGSKTILAIGCENGHVMLYVSEGESLFREWREYMTLDTL